MPAIGATIEVKKKNSTIANDARDWIAFILLLVKTALRRFRLLKSHQLTLELRRVDAAICAALLCDVVSSLVVSLEAN